MEKNTLKRQVIVVIALIAILVITATLYDFFIKALGSRGFVLMFYVLPVLLAAVIFFWGWYAKIGINFLKRVTQSPEQEKEQEIMLLKKHGNLEGARRVEAMSLSQINGIQKTSAFVIIAGLIYTTAFGYFDPKIDGLADNVAFFSGLAVIGGLGWLCYRRFSRKAIDTDRPN